MCRRRRLRADPRLPGPARHRARGLRFLSQHGGNILESQQSETVVDAHHVLLDDRALVEVRGHVVGGGADQLDAAVEGLVVGPRALEARQERVVDVDRLPRQRPAGLVGEHLHVARQHHQVDVQLVDEREHPPLGVGLRVRRDRDVVERHAVRRGQRLAVEVVRHDRRPRRSAATLAPPEQQVVEAVAELRDQDQRPVRRVGRPQLPGHREPLCDRGERRRSESTVASPSTANRTRMKNRPSARSPYCWLSTMCRGAPRAGR